jgi:hypothetical protein
VLLFIMLFIMVFIIIGFRLIILDIKNKNELKVFTKKQRKYEQDQHFKAQSWIIDTVDLLQLEAPQEVKSQWSPQYQAYVEGVLKQYREQCERYGTPIKTVK